MVHLAKTLDVTIEDKITHLADTVPAAREGQEVAGTPIASPRRRRWRTLLLAGAAVIAVAAAGDFGWRYWAVGRFLESTDDAYVKADTTVIAPKVSGYLREVLVRDNESVKAGQPLARIDDRDYAVAARQAEADVQAAQADIDDAKASLDQQEAVIAQNPVQC